MPPALVLGSPHYTTLGVIRALASGRIPQFTVGAGASFVSYSRWHRRLPGQSQNGPTPESLATFLEGLPIEQMVLIPCSDPWVAAVSRLEPTVAARFPASIAPPEAIDACLDKGRFADLLARLAVPHPRTIPIGPTDDVRTFWDGGLRDPFLKPRNSSAFSARFGEKALLVGSADEAMMRIRETRRAGVEFLLQEYIPGSAGSNYYVDGFVDRGGTFCAQVARRRVRASDKPFNIPTCAVTIPIDEVKEPLAILRRLLAALRYRGVFSAHFKYDDRDGLFKLLEINSRVWGGVSLLVNCAVNVVEMAYRDALGLPVARIAEYPADRFWVDASRDRVVCWRLLRDGRLTIKEWLRTRVGAVQAMFRWDDPLPAIVGFLLLIWRGIRARSKARL